MYKLLITLAFIVIGGIFFKYFSQEMHAYKYESKTAKLIEEIDNIPPTAAGRN